MMTTVAAAAIGYIRISVKDQSVYSINYQRTAIIEYCAFNKLDLLALFTDHGESGYTFYRPNWLALEQFLKQHKGEVRYIITIDHDRLSRNMAEALTKIERLEKQFSVKVLSIDDPICTDTNTPESFLNRAFKLLMANTELLKIRDRTRRGIRQALESGRIVNNAPFGYKNKRDENNKPIIVVDRQKALIVKQIFEDFLIGVPSKEILTEAKKKGFTLRGKSALTRLLTNPNYAGLIKIPAANGLPEKIVQGLHTPLIDRAVYWRIQEIVTKRSRNRSIPTGEIPLRGLIRCSCGAALTGGFSKGKKKYYLYYTCVKERNLNYPGNALHELFYDILDELYFTQNLGVQIIKYMEGNLREALVNKSLTIVSVKRELNDIERKLDRLEECLIDKHVDPETYKKWHKKFLDQKVALQSEITALSRENSDIWCKLKETLPLLRDIKGIYIYCNFHTKQKLIRKIFEAGLTYDGSIFTTPYLHPAILYKGVRTSGKLLKREVSQQLTVDFDDTYPNILKIEGNEKLEAIGQELADFIARLIVENILEKSYDQKFLMQI